jgi:photosystem II stability/assembly factor-like uncharacterized protein
MKLKCLLIYLIFTFLYCSKITEPDEKSGWYLQYDNQDEITFYGIHFVNENIGWIIGCDGAIKKSDNGGDSWILLQSRVTSDLWDISFINDQVGWVCGSNNTILKTNNGGESWNTLLSDSTSDKIFVALQFYDENIGWMSSNQGEILRSVDGGSSWEIVKDDNLGGAQLAVLDSNSAYCLSGQLYYTSDGGKTWESYSIPTPKNYFISNFYFTDQNRGFVTLSNGSGGAIITEFPILSTIDGGSNWELSDYLKDSGFSCVYFVDQNNGWIGGIENIYKTKDAGNSWTLDFTPEDDFLYLKDICFINKNVGWVINYNGQIYKYENE